MSIAAITDGNLTAERSVPGTRPCVHCFRPHRSPPHVRVVCPACRDTEAALNGGTSPTVQVAFGVTRPPGLQPWWTPDEDRVADAVRHGGRGSRPAALAVQTACNFRFKTLRRAGRLRPFDHREWSPHEDARVAAITSPAEIRALARELDRSVASVHRRRGELRQRGVRVTGLRRAKNRQHRSREDD